MKHTVAHGLPTDVARRVVDDAFSHYRERFGAYRPALRWTDADTAEVSFSALGLRVGGTLRLLPGALEVAVDIPLPLRAFRGRAVAAVEREVGRWAGEARRAARSPS